MAGPEPRTEKRASWNTRLPSKQGPRGCQWCCVCAASGFREERSWLVRTVQCLPSAQRPCAAKAPHGNGGWLGAARLQQLVLKAQRFLSPGVGWWGRGVWWCRPPGCPTLVSRSQSWGPGDHSVASFSGLGFVPGGQAVVPPQGSLVCSRPSFRCILGKVRQQ